MAERKKASKTNKKANQQTGKNTSSICSLLGNGKLSILRLERCALFALG